jgi:hypothetical protein
MVIDSRSMDRLGAFRSANPGSRTCETGLAPDCPPPRQCRREGEPRFSAGDHRLIGAYEPDQLARVRGPTQS